MPPLTLRRLLPTAEAAVDAAAAYAYPDAAPWVRANMVSSVDGAAAFSGRVGALTAPVDQRLLGLLRELADVIVVGAGTIRAEGYGMVQVSPPLAEARRRHGQRPIPTFAVVSGRLDLDLTGRLFAEPATRPLLFTTARAPGERVAAAKQVADVVVAEADRVEPTALLATLAYRGLTRVLCEGGPHLLAEFMSADALDELCLAIAPRWTSGTALRIASGPQLPSPVPLRLAGLFEADGFLFTRYQRARDAPG